MPHPLFAPFRALGYICDHVPFAVQRLGKETFVTVSVGKSWQVYNCAKLKLVMVGPPLPLAISSLAASHELTLAALGNGDVHVHRRSEFVRVLPFPNSMPSHSDTSSDTSSAQQHEGDERPLMLVMGDNLLVLYRGSGKMAVWNIKDESAKPQRVIELPSGFQPTCFCHPDTYLNKVAVGSTDGRIAIWNFKTGTCVFESSALVDVDRPQGITCLVSSPGLDVVGVGLTDGRAMLHNLKYDETVAEFANASGVGLQQDMFLVGRAPQGALQVPPAVHSITFRTGAGLPLMAVGGEAGVITVWNLEQRRLHTVIKDAHDGPICNLHFFVGEPVLMSQAGDNSIKQWIFDNTDNSARLLRFRSGHASPPVRVRGYGEDGKRLLSAGTDRAFRLFSTVQDHQSRELSQGHVQHRAKRLKVTQEELKLPAVRALDACQVRERDWCNVLTGHEGTAAAYVWRLQNLCRGEAVLKLPQELAQKLPASVAKSPVTAVAISKCGNYGFVGSAAGRVDMYNMQSGLHRGSYSRGKSIPEGKTVTVDLPAHEGSVTGVASDTANQTLLTCGRDGMLRCWDFKKRTLRYQLNVGAHCFAMAYHPASCLVAVACEGDVGGAAQLRVYDSGSQRLVRKFDMPRHVECVSDADGGDAVSDICISADSRWLLATGNDGIVAVWDIPSAQMQQVMYLGNPVTSLTLSPQMDLLTTTHKGKRGLFLWTNQLLFGPADSILPSSTPIRVDLPSVATGTYQEEESAAESDEAHHVQHSGITAVPESNAASARGPGAPKTGPAGPLPLAPSMVTMSMLPRSQWHTLAHLDAIKERSRPVQPPKKPEAAPFFLPTVPTLAGEPQFDLNANVDGTDGTDGQVEHSSGVISRIKGAKGSEGAAQPRSAPSSPLIAALRAYGAAKTCGTADQQMLRLLALLRTMTPSALDLEIRAMQVLDAEEESDIEQQVQDLQYLLQFLVDAAAARNNFDFIQALLQLVLRVHSETIMQHGQLKQLAAQLHEQLESSWAKLNAALQQVRCMASMFGGWPVA